MRASTLRDSLSHNGRENARLLERQWQTAWLTAVIPAVPSRGLICPDVSAIYGSPGYLDFYIDGGLRWGVEIMREGNRLTEHRSRFMTEGRYGKIPFSN